MRAGKKLNKEFGETSPEVQNNGIHGPRIDATN